MLADRYELPLSTASSAARDAYVQGSVLLLTLYPGATDAFDRAIAADPGFALAHAGKAQAAMREGDAQAARAAMEAAKSVADGVSAREASHLNYFDLLFSGHAEAALKALRSHLAAWPRDALVLTTTATPNGLIGASGRIGQKHEIAALMDSLAPAYGDDWWFLAHHALALSEDGRNAAARPKIERSMAQNPHNANAAHGFAHVCYETGETDAARAFLRAWLATYPREAFFHGHLNWHLALGELEAGNMTDAFRLYHDSIALAAHSGSPQLKLVDAAAFLWRAELAGQPHNPEAWRSLSNFAARFLSLPSNGHPDVHVVLAQAAAGDASALDAHVRQMEDLTRGGRYASGSYVPALARAFAAFQRQDYTGVIEMLEPLAEETERVGGSRAQHDLIGFTLLKACLEAGRHDAARRQLARRRPGAAGVPVAGLAAVH